MVINFTDIIMVTWSSSEQKRKLDKYIYIWFFFRARSKKQMKTQNPLAVSLSYMFASIYSLENRVKHKTLGFEYSKKFN